MPPRQPSPFTAEPDAGATSPSGRFRAYKHAGLALLCFVWIAVGLIGHDPWKTEDATSFGVTWDMVNGGSLLTPTLVGEPYLDHPPLLYAFASVTTRLFQSWLSAPDGSRIAVGVLLAITLAFLSLTGRELGGKSLRWLPVLIFVGCVGLWERSHFLAPENGLLAGLAIAQYGWALSLRRPLAGGATAGAGAAFSFLVYGLLGPLWIVLTAVLLPVAFANWRSRAYAKSAAVALGVAAVGIGAWPLALALVAPSHLALWWADQNASDFLGPLAHAKPDALFLLRTLPWYLWPASPLVFWTLWTRARGFGGGFAIPALQIPLVLSIVMLLSIQVMPEQRVIQLMMVIVPFALLGALDVDTLGRSFSGALDWFGILTFGLLAALGWWAWWDAYLHGMSPPIAGALRDTTLGYQPSFHGRAVAICVLLTLAWLALVRPARRSNRRALLNWAAGSTLLWAMYMTIWLPYLDSRRSYRHVAEEAAMHLPRSGCIESRNLGEPQRALFYYFSGIRTEREESSPDAKCPTVLVQYGRGEREIALPAGWTKLWQGQRRGDDTERFVIYSRRPRR